MKFRNKEKTLHDLQVFSPKRLAQKIRKSFNIDEVTEGEIEYALIHENRKRLAEIFVDLAERNQTNKETNQKILEQAQKAYEVGRQGPKGGNREGNARVLKAGGGPKG